MVLNVTPEEREQFKALNRLRMKNYRDKKRVRKYAPRGKNRTFSCVQPDKESKQ